MPSKKQLTKQFKVHIRYQLKDGTRVPGNTTVVGSWGENKGPLMNWAWKMGLEEVDIYDYMSQMKTIGKLGHALILSPLSSEVMDIKKYSQEQIDAAENAQLSWLEWLKGHEIEPILIEAPLVSEQHKFGGTPDIYGRVNGKLEVIDLKTGSGIYQSHFVQVAAYKQLLEENGYQVESVRILNIPRTEDETFQEQTVRNLDAWWKIFKCLLGAYYEHQKIKPQYKKTAKRKVKK